MENISRKNLKVFGWGLVVILTFFGTRSWMEHGVNGFVFCCSALMVFFAMITALDRPLLKKIYHYWMKAAGVISRIITSFILIILYYFLFTPIGFLLKLSNADLLERKTQKDAASYWVPLEEKPFNKDQYHKQF